MGNSAKKQDFLDHLPLLERWGWNRFLPLAHAIHETNDFTRIIGNWNCWGLKIPHKVKWSGLMVSAKTHEVINGTSMSVVDGFVDFPDVTAALSYYDAFIKRVYPKAYDVKDGKAHDYAQALFEGGYATDPNYISAFLMRYHAL